MNWARPRGTPNMLPIADLGFSLRCRQGKIAWLNSSSASRQIISQLCMDVSHHFAIKDHNIQSTIFNPKSDIIPPMARLLLTLLVLINLALVCQGHDEDGHHTGVHLTFLGEPDDGMNSLL